MAKENIIGRNYIFFGGWLNFNYMYIDLKLDGCYAADSLFYKRAISVKITSEAAREGDKYSMILCRIKKRDRKAFEDALEEIRTKLSLLGHNDYDEYCRDLMKEAQAL